jgi:predicted MFS family arabinose efflux permease
MYLIATAVTLLLALALRIFLPRQEPALRLSYPGLLRSLPGLLREPLLRRHAILGALALAAFSAFWTTLTFLLEAPPFRLGSGAAGAFGIVGVAGALAAPLAGRLADRIGTRAVNGLALLLVLISYCVFAASGRSLVLLGVGVVLLDLGVQANHISNQTRILGLSADARNRLNSVYIAIYFTGAAAGSALASHAYASWRWAGVSALGIGLALLALVAFFTLDTGAAKAADEAAATRRREFRMDAQEPLSHSPVG